MPSFDVVSEFDKHEALNAVDQANRELQSRFDFKGVQADFNWENDKLKSTADSLFQLQQMLEILRAKLIKRGIDVRVVDPEEAVQGGLKAHQYINLKKGINAEDSKKIVNLIKQVKIKVQTQIQGDQVRINGKKRDDLQAVISLLKEDKTLDLALQFTNFRD